MEIKYCLGCGENKRRGFVNVDSSKDVEPDIVEDVTITPWIWAKKSQADLIFADNLFEHIREEPLLRVMQECHRVLKPNGLLQIIVPISAPDNFMAMFSDSSHVNHNFTAETYDWFDHRNIRWKKYGRAYGNPKFERTMQRRNGRFLEVELKVIK